MSHGYWIINLIFKGVPICKNNLKYGVDLNIWIIYIFENEARSLQVERVMFSFSLCKYCRLRNKYW